VPDRQLHGCLAVVARWRSLALKCARIHAAMSVDSHIRQRDATDIVGPSCLFKLLSSRGTSIVVYKSALANDNEAINIPGEREFVRSSAAFILTEV
jgi:hypothetical protein